MTLKEKSLYHQIHPFKLATDIGCEPLSLYFFWRHALGLGLATHFLPPIAASLLLICCGDFEAIKRSRAGAYLQRHMTTTIEAIRFAGDMLMVLGAWFHEPSLIVMSLVVIVIAWCSGCFRKAHMYQAERHKLCASLRVRKKLVLGEWHREYRLERWRHDSDEASAQHKGQHKGHKGQGIDR